MNEPNEVARIGELRDNHEKAGQRLKKLGTAARLLTLTLVTVFAVALFMLYGKMTNMYAPEKFEEPLMREAQRLIPQIEPELVCRVLGIEWRACRRASDRDEARGGERAIGYGDRDTVGA